MFEDFYSDEWVNNNVYTMQSTHTLGHFFSNDTSFTGPNMLLRIDVNIPFANRVLWIQIKFLTVWIWNEFNRLFVQYLSTMQLTVFVNIVGGWIGWSVLLYHLSYTRYVHCTYPWYIPNTIQTSQMLAFGVHSTFEEFTSSITALARERELISKP